MIKIKFKGINMTKLEKLVDYLKTGERIFIQMHNSPDPDSIATAYGLWYLLKEKGVESQICYKGEIEKYSTQRMAELLHIKLTNIKDIKDMKKEDYIILVDSQKGNSNVTDFIGDEIASIDHHPIFMDIEYAFADIRPNVGACSSIIAEYFYENNIEIPISIATALLYGIKTDTLNLSRGVDDLDLDMFYKLYKQADIDLLNDIMINKLQFSELIAYANAIKNIKVYGTVGIINIGLECPDSLLATINDFILSLKEVDFAIVYSHRESGIKFSIRNEVKSLDAGKIVANVLDGLGNGGGHKMMAGGFLPRENIKKIGSGIDSYLENKFIDVIDSHVSNS